MGKRAGLFERIASSLAKAREDARRKKVKAKEKKAQKKSKSKKVKKHLTDTQYVKRYEKGLSRLIDEANDRMIQIDQRNLISKAMFDIDPSGNLNKTMFSISEDITRNEFIALKLQVQSFLNDPTSTIEGAEKFTEENYNTYFAKRHSTKQEGDVEASWQPGLFIPLEFARAAYSAYRSAIEDAQIAAESLYDSENLIMYTFSFIESHGIYAMDSDDARGAVVEALRKYAEEQEEKRKEEIKKITSGRSPKSLGSSSRFRKG